MLHSITRHRQATASLTPYSTPEFVLELTDVVKAPVRVWIRGRARGVLAELAGPTLVVAACTGCGVRVEGLVRRADAAAVRSLVARLGDADLAGFHGFATFHAGCTGLVRGRWRSAEWRVPLMVSRQIGRELDQLLDTTLPGAYTATRGQARRNPQLSLEYLTQLPSNAVERATIAITPPSQFMMRYDLRDVIAAAHVEMRYAEESAAARGGSVEAAVLTISGLPRRPHTADVIVATRGGAFRKRPGGQLDGYSRPWKPITAPHDAVDGLLPTVTA